MRFTVQVVDESGEPVGDKKVTVMFTSLLRGWVEEFTDGDGQADFDDGAIAPGDAKIYIDDVVRGPYYIDDGDSYTVEV